MLIQIISLNNIAYEKIIIKVKSLIKKQPSRFSTSFSWLPNKILITYLERNIITCLFKCAHSLHTFTVKLANLIKQKIINFN